MNLDELIQQVTRLQQRFDSLIKPETGRWMDWTPTITQVGALTLTINSARYKTNDNLVNIMAELTVASGTGTGGNAIVIGGIPTAIQPTGLLGSSTSTIGTCFMFDTSAPAAYYGFLVVQSASDWRLRDSNTRGAMGVNPNVALAVGDQITFRGSYER